MPPAHPHPDRPLPPCLLFARLAALAGAGPLEQALACLDPAEEERLSCLLGKLERRLGSMPAPAENGGGEHARLEERS